MGCRNAWGRMASFFCVWGGERCERPMAQKTGGFCSGGKKIRISNFSASAFPYY